MFPFEEDTVEFKTANTFADQFFAPSVPRFQLRPAASTHVGKVRSRNEDHYAVLRSTRSREVLLTNLPREGLAMRSDESYGLVVADGIGGSSSGDVASRLALQTMLDLSNRATSWIMKITDLEAQEIYKRVEAYVTEIQKAFRSSGEQDPSLAGMGTTWTSAHLFAPRAVVVHIGDSRAYLHRDAELELVTRDQTLGQEMADAGVPPETVRRFRSILTNSLGGNAEEVQAEIYDFTVQPGDRLLLCTDGLSDMVPDSQIAEVLQRISDPQAACDKLVDEALEAGGKDNITVVVCDIHATDPPSDQVP